eukprot:2462967-Alexandrium_andersonii.AAC.1
MAPPARYRPPLASYSRAESERGRAAAMRQKVYTHARDNMRMPLPKTKGIPPKPAGAPAVGGGAPAPKTPPK